MHNIIPGMFIALIRDIHYIMLNLKGIFGFIKNRNCFCVSVRMRLLSETGPVNRPSLTGTVLLRGG